VGDQLHLLTHGIPAVLFGVLLVLLLIGTIGAIWGIRRGLEGGERILRMTAAILGLAGLGVATYVVVSVEVLNQIPQCVGGGGGCAAVEHSSYSRIQGVHVSVLGVVGYSMILFATAWRGDNARMAAFFLSLFGFGFSLYLTYLELWEILAICQWCVASATAMTMLFVVNTCRLIVFYGTRDPDDRTTASEEPDARPV
jgi:uncharacterized membrane protein